MGENRGITKLDLDTGKWDDEDDKKEDKKHKEIPREDDHNIPDQVPITESPKEFPLSLPDIEPLPGTGKLPPKEGNA